MEKEKIISSVIFLIVYSLLSLHLILSIFITLHFFNWLSSCCNLLLLEVNFSKWKRKCSNVRASGLFSAGSIMHPWANAIISDLELFFCYITCKGISVPNEKRIYALLAFKRRNDMEQKLRSSLSFCRTTKKYARKDVLQNAKLFTL